MFDRVLNKPLYGIAMAVNGVIWYGATFFDLRRKFLLLIFVILAPPKNCNKSFSIVFQDIKEINRRSVRSSLILAT